MAVLVALAYAPCAHDPSHIHSLTSHVQYAVARGPAYISVHRHMPAYAQVRFSENIDFQYPMKEACQVELAKYCKDVPHGNARAIRWEG